MCIIFRFYHLCGHTHYVTTFPCTYTPTRPSLYSLLPGEILSYPGSGVEYGALTCLADTAGLSEDVHLFPTLCAKCEQVGIISEWLARTPGGRFEVIQAWKKTHRPEVRKQQTLQSEIADLESFDSEQSNTASEGTGGESQRGGDTTDPSSSTALGNSPPQAKPSSGSRRTTNDSSSLRQALEALTSRVRQRISELKKEELGPDRQCPRVRTN